MSTFCLTQVYLLYPFVCDALSKPIYLAGTYHLKPRANARSNDIISEHNPTQTNLCSWMKAETIWVGTRKEQRCEPQQCTKWKAQKSTMGTPAWIYFLYARDCRKIEIEVFHKQCEVFFPLYTIRVTPLCNFMCKHIETFLWSSLRRSNAVVYGRNCMCIVLCWISDSRNWHMFAVLFLPFAITRLKVKSWPRPLHTILYLKFKRL